MNKQQIGTLWVVALIIDTESYQPQRSGLPDGLNTLHGTKFGY